MSERPWYKRFPSDFLAGTSELTVEEKGAYTVVIDLIYDRHGPLPNDSQWLGRVAGCSTRMWNGLRDALIAKGKISFTEDGLITCARAVDRMESEAAEAATVRENGAKGGRKSAENRRKIAPNSAGNLNDPAKINDLVENSLPALPDTRYQNHSSPKSEPARGGERGTRLPDNWHPSADGIALAESLGLDPDRVLAKFLDYWRAQPGARGRKADWNATWRNWARSEAERRGSPTSAQLPLLRPIDGGKALGGPIDASDDWGIEAFCVSIGAERLTDPKAMAKGNFGYQGRAIDATARQVALAAGFHRAWRGDWSLLRGWVDAGLSTQDHILPAIHRVTAWYASREESPKSLAAFDKAVREARAA